MLLTQVNIAPYLIENDLIIQAKMNLHQYLIFCMFVLDFLLSFRKLFQLVGIS